MPVRHRGHHVVQDKPGGRLDVLLVAGRAEPPALAGKGQQVFVLAMVAANPGEAALQVAAIQELVDHLWDDGPQAAVAGLVLLGISLPRTRRSGGGRTATAATSSDFWRDKLAVIFSGRIDQSAQPLAGPYSSAGAPLIPDRWFGDSGPGPPCRRRFPDFIVTSAGVRAAEHPKLLVGLLEVAKAAGRCSAQGAGWGLRHCYGTATVVLPWGPLPMGALPWQCRGP